MTTAVYREQRRRIIPPQLTWQRLLRVAGTRAGALRFNIWKLFFAAVFQAAALSSILPLASALFLSHEFIAAAGWLIGFSLFFSLSAMMRWSAYNFEFNGEMIMITQLLRTELGKKIRNIPLHEIHQARSGEIVHTLLTSVDTTLSYVLGVVNAVFSAFFVPVIVALVMFWFDWRLAVGLLLIFPVIVFFYYLRRPVFGASAKEVEQAHKKLYADTVEYIQGLPVLKSTGQESVSGNALRAQFTALEALQARDTRLGASPNLFMTSAIELGLLLVTLLGVYLVAAGQLSLAVFGAFLVISIRFAEPLASLVLYTYMFDVLESSMDDLDSVLSRPDQIVRQPVAQPSGGEIVFDNVTFDYDIGKSRGLRDVSLHFPEKSLTAIVGPSGAGKTTIIKLLQRYDDPRQGAIRIGGIDIRNIEAAKLAALVSVVFQDVYLFDDTVFNNIRMARPSATVEEVMQAARLANCDAFVQRLPRGYDTLVGERGGKLSGGEKQRISIARAVLKDSPILVLDEPTASLDTENETIVQQALSSLVRNRTVIVISHRLSTIRGADNIVVLKDGQVAEQGTHAELIARQGVYHCMNMA